MKKVVTIGGGTGSFTLLSGLKKYPIENIINIHAADDTASAVIYVLHREPIYPANTIVK